MKKIVFIHLYFFISFLNAQDTITKKVKDFEILKVYNGIDLKLVKSDKQELVLTGEKTNKVKIKERKNTLKILLRFPETTADGKVRATLYYNKDIVILDANEGSSISGDTIQQSFLEVKAQEAAYIDLAVKVKHLTVKGSSGGVIKLTGNAKNQEVKLTLGAIYRGYKLAIENISMVNAGSGAKAEVSSGETMDAKVSFGGTIFYKGKPEVIKEKKVIGGTIEQRK